MRLLIALIVVLLIAPCAHAGVQEPEIAVVNGRVMAMYSHPLAPLLKSRETRPAGFRSDSSKNFRGYVGEWHVEGNRLLLVALDSEATRPSVDDVGRRDRRGLVPLSDVVPDAQGPVPATWFTGTLRLADGPYLFSANGGSTARFTHELRIRVERGIVVSQRRVATWKRDMARDMSDVFHVEQGAEFDPARHDGTTGDWKDLRSLRAPSRNDLPKGMLRVRGRLSLVYTTFHPLSEHLLWLDETALSRPVGVPLVGVPPDVKRLGDYEARVEVEASWIRRGLRTVLRVHHVRGLDAGETVYHPDWQPGVDPWLATEFRLLAEENMIESPEDVANQATSWQLVRVRGRVSRTELPRILNVDVGRSAETPKHGSRVEAVGYVQRWVITKHLLDMDLPDLRMFRGRKPGTWFRLVDVETGKLAIPVPAR